MSKKKKWFIKDSPYLNQLRIEPTIATVYGSGDELGENARLIAAAPDLLKALEIVEPIIDDVTESVEPGRMIRAAIAKARGEE